MKLEERTFGTPCVVNFAFILLPLPPRQTRSVFTIVKWEKPGHIRKRVYSSKLDFSKKSPSVTTANVYSTM